LINPFTEYFADKKYIILEACVSHPTFFWWSKEIFLYQNALWPEYNQVQVPCKACQLYHLFSQDFLQYGGCCAAENSASKTMLRFFETFVSPSQGTSTSLFDAVHYIPYTYASQATVVFP
jgi:hypothetical protein